MRPEAFIGDGWIRLAVAALISPIVAASAVAAIFIGDAPYSENALDSIRSVASLALIVGYPAMLMLGLPAHTVLLKTGLRSGFAYVAAGAILGLVLALTLATVFHPEIGEATGHIVLACALTAGLFWLIRRPDRDLPAA